MASAKEVIVKVIPPTIANEFVKKAPLLRQGGAK